MSSTIAKGIVMLDPPIIVPADSSTTARAALIATFAFLAIILLIRSPSAKSSAQTALSRQYQAGTTKYGSGTLGGGPRIGKVTMLYGETPNPLYERAVRSHRLHNERWNYPMFVLREQITGGYWNKPSYLLSLIVQELAKPRSERLEWLMWVDADLILINPSIPLSIFLPPAHLFPDTHFLGNRDQNGLNTGTFFLHVHEWSVKMLVKAIAYPMSKPDVDLGVSMDQEAMAHVFNDTSPYVPKTSADWEKLRKAEKELSASERIMRNNLRAGVGGTNGEVLFQPRVWYNTYEWHHAYEGKKGNLLVHFPGLEDDRWRHMSDWLDVVENTPAKWDMPLEETHYPAEIKAYYNAIVEARKVLVDADKLTQDHSDDASQRKAVEYLKGQAEQLRTLLNFGTDRLNDTSAIVDHIKTLLPKDDA